MVQVAASIAHAASTAFPPFVKMVAPAVAASGLPVIATGWSGHLDFLNKGKFINVSYNLKDIHQSRVDNRIFLPHMKWAEVIEEDAKKKLIKFRASHSTPRDWAKELEVIIKEKYSFATICQAYGEAIKEIL